MVESEAHSRICPHMSNVLNQSMNTPGVADIMVNWETYCVGSRCMAWEVTAGIDMLEGYCKLMEEKM